VAKEHRTRASVEMGNRLSRCIQYDIPFGFVLPLFGNTTILGLGRFIVAHGRAPHVPARNCAGIEEQERRGFCERRAVGNNRVGRLV
jgi:hypothetical protein